MQNTNNPDGIGNVYPDSPTPPRQQLTEADRVYPAPQPYFATPPPAHNVNQEPVLSVPLMNNKLAAQQVAKVLHEVDNLSTTKQRTVLRNALLSVVEKLTIDNRSTDLLQLAGEIRRLIDKS